ncbi:PXA domain-containing protein [Roridomyces roridus]|uniref:PXA domain-containing protein n=1 Tax=Roridomyces roridus TaxID=1738132 RepID=A0AAD7BTX8_9AGAR|nr:PXA domain-containing protein [Roridomyces roridus]
MAASITSKASANVPKASLSKRLLFPTWPSNDLPPLFAAPSTPPELTAELYDFIALALRAFVNPWWTKISRYDKEFLPDIARILTHVVRALETRVLDADLVPLVFHDVPAIVTQHYRDYRNAAAKVSTSYASGGALGIPLLFHNAQPHMAVAADGTIDPEYMRQLVDHILKSCLPPEDYAPEPERYVIREIVVKILLQDVIPKITQPWFIQKIILDSLGQQSVLLSKPRPPSPPASHFSYHTLIVVALSAIQALSSVGLAMAQAYRHAVTTIKRVNQSPQRLQTTRVSASPLFPPRSPASVPIPVSPNSPSISASSSISSSWAASAPQESPVAAIYAQSNHALPALMLVSEIFTTSARMAASSIMHTISLVLLLFSPFLDRLLPYLLAQALSPKLLLTITLAAKRTLFPNGYPAPPPPDPTPEEQAQMRARLLAYRGKSPWVETHLLPLVLGSDPSETLAAALDPLTSRECNVHLVMLLLDCIIGTLFPELLGA